MKQEERIPEEKVIETNYIVKKTTDYQLQKLDDMKKKLPRFINNRKKAFAEEYEKYVELNTVNGVLLPEENKIPMYKLVQSTFSPILKTTGITPKYSASELYICFEFYKKCAEKLNEIGVYPPKIEDFCSLIDIPRSKFEYYRTSSPDENTRDVCEKVIDYCTARVADGAFVGTLEKIYSIFHQKSSNKQRDNEPVVNNTFIQNNTILTNEEKEELRKKYLSND